MDDMWMRIATDLVERTRGPMKFRLVLQPLMAAAYAIYSGLKDAKAGNPPYFWSLASDSSHRAEEIRDGWKHIGKVFILAIVLDVVYQVIALHTVYPGEAAIVAVVLALFPYVILRGLVDRLVRKR